MWITALIVVGFVAATIAMAYFWIAAQHDAIVADGHAGGDAMHCGLCQAPLRRSITSDEVVFELEHRIDADLCELARTARTGGAPLRSSFPA